MKSDQSTEKQKCNFLLIVFMSENGTDCFMSKVDHIATCLNGSLNELEDIFRSMQNSNNSVFNDKSCRCVVDYHLTLFI